MQHLCSETIILGSCCFLLDIDHGEALSHLLDAEKELFGNNFAQVVMIHAASALAANYDLVVNDFGGCAVPVIIGQPVAGKSTALKAVLSVFGIFSFTNGMWITNSQIGQIAN